MEFNPIESIISAGLFTLYILYMFFRIRKKKLTAPITFSDTQQIRNIPRAWRARFAYLPQVFRALAILFLLIAFCRPRLGTEIVRTTREGIAIQMVVDRSSSMTEAIEYNGNESSRLDVVKSVFKKFVLGNQQTLKGRPNDMIGLTSFAGFVDENAPLSMDHQSIINLSETILPAERTEDGTMIGDAIYYAALRLVAMEDLLKNKQVPLTSSPYHIKSKVMILLTDGQQTRGGFSPVEAAKFAKKHNIKIYTIAITDDTSQKKNNSIFGGFFSSFPRQVDTRFLKKVAELTGGLFAKASSGDSLEKIYQKIDEMEKSKFEEHFTTYKEQFQLFVYIGLTFLLFEILLRQLVFRKLP